MDCMTSLTTILDVEQWKSARCARPQPFIICNCQRPVFSLGESQYMHKVTNLWKFQLKLVGSCEILMKIKNPLSHKVVCFLMLGFESSSSKSEVSKSTSWKITSISKNTLLQMEPFLTMFYTINLSPLLIPSEVLL